MTRIGRRSRFEQEFLTGPQRQKLQVARDYAGQVGVQMWHWWQTAGDEDGTGDPAAAEEIVAKVQVLAREEPKKGLRRIDPAELEHKPAEWKQEVEMHSRLPRQDRMSTRVERVGCR